MSWPVGAKSPKTKQAAPTTGLGALNGAFWGMLFGLLFFVPFFGLAVGAAMGALAGHFSDYGIDDQFIKSVRSKVTEGTSALFALTSGAVVDKVTEAFKTLPKFEIIQTNLSKEQEDKLRRRSLRRKPPNNQAFVRAGADQLRPDRGGWGMRRPRRGGLV